MPTTAIVLTGGRSTRFGSDKTRALIDGVPLLDHVLGSLPHAWPIIAVGPARPTSREVTWVREEPVFSGLLAGLAAGLKRTETANFVLVGGDMPHVGNVPQTLAGRLTSEVSNVDAVVARTPDGRLQPLLLAARAELSRAATPRDPTDASVMRWLRALRWVPHDIGQGPAHDIDAPVDLA